MSSLREINTENQRLYYPGNKINIKDLDLDKILVYERPYQNNFIYRFAYKTTHGVRPLHISFDKVFKYIAKYDTDLYLSLFHPHKKYVKTFNSIKCVSYQKIDTSDAYYCNYAKIKVNSDDGLPLEKILNAIIFIGSIFCRIDVSEDIDANKTGDWLEYVIFYYWYFLEINFKFQRKVRESCHDMTQKSMSFNDFAIVTIRRNYYKINIWSMSKSNTVYRMKKADLSEKSRQS